MYEQTVLENLYNNKVESVLKNSKTLQSGIYSYAMNQEVQASFYLSH